MPLLTSIMIMVDSSADTGDLSMKTKHHAKIIAPMSKSNLVKINGLMFFMLLFAE